MSRRRGPVPLTSAPDSWLVELEAPGRCSICGHGDIQHPADGPCVHHPRGEQRCSCPRLETGGSR